MLLIVIDRLLCVLLQLKYRYYITPTRIKMMLYVSWSLGIAYMITLCLLDVEDIDSFSAYEIFIADCVFIVLALITYGSIFWSLKHAPKSKHTQQKNKQLVPMMIILTFVLFYCIPDMIHMVHNNHTVGYAIMFIWNIGWTFDPLTYIFLDERNREQAFKFFRICYRSFITADSAVYSINTYTGDVSTHTE